MRLEMDVYGIGNGNADKAAGEGNQTKPNQTKHALASTLPAATATAADKLLLSTPYATPKPPSPTGLCRASASVALQRQLSILFWPDLQAETPPGIPTA